MEADPMMGLQISKRFIGSGIYQGSVTRKAIEVSNDHYEVSWNDGAVTTMTGNAISKCQKIA